MSGDRVIVPDLGHDLKLSLPDSDPGLLIRRKNLFDLLLGPHHLHVRVSRNQHVQGLTVIGGNVASIFLGTSSTNQNFATSLLLKTLLVRTSGSNDESSVVKLGIAGHVDFPLDFVAITDILAERVDSIRIIHSRSIGVVSDVGRVIGGIRLHFVREARLGEHIAEEGTLLSLEGFCLGLGLAVDVERRLDDLAVLVPQDRGVIRL